MSKKLRKTLFLSGATIIPIVSIGAGTYFAYESGKDYQYEQIDIHLTTNQDYLKDISSQDVNLIKEKVISDSQDSSGVSISLNNDEVSIVGGGKTEVIKMDKIISYFSWEHNISYFNVKKFFGNPTVGHNYTFTNMSNINEFKNFIFGIYTKILSDSSFVYYQETLTSLKDIIENKKQELGVYYTGPGTFPWATFIKHSILADSDATIFRIYDETTSLSHQSEFNAQAFVDFKKSRGFTGRVIQHPRALMSAFHRRIMEYLDDNKNRKINLFLNFNNIGSWPANYDLLKFNMIDRIMTKYPNVSIHGIEDGSTLTKTLINRGLTYWRKTAPVYYAAHSDRINGYSIINNEVNTFDNQTKILSPSSDWLSDKLFEKRHPGDGSYFSNWTKILGIDWESMHKKIDIINSNGKPSLMILGSYGVYGEKAWIKNIWLKYKDTYNVFFKGHPGHNASSEEISLEINRGENDMIHQTLHMLPANLPSEELTNNHVSEGLKFDKFAMSDWSGAIEDIPANGYNTKHDLLEILIGTTAANSQQLTVGSASFDNFMQSNTHARTWWGKYAR